VPHRRATSKPSSVIALPQSRHSIRNPAPKRAKSAAVLMCLVLTSRSYIERNDSGTLAAESAEAHNAAMAFHPTYAFALLALSAPAQSQTIVAAQPHTSVVNGFIVTEGDIADRAYVQVGTVTAKAGKFSWVSRNPDRTDVDRKLREKAQELGADAVIRVQYTPTGASLMSWGGIKADGVAVKYSSPPAIIPQQQVEDRDED
jgi:uncharacterized protein YbjQ (UPF0145 family)